MASQTHLQWIQISLCLIFNGFQPSVSASALSVPWHARHPQTTPKSSTKTKILGKRELKHIGQKSRSLPGHNFFGFLDFVLRENLHEEIQLISGSNPKNLEEIQKKIHTPPKKNLLTPKKFLNMIVQNRQKSQQEIAEDKQKLRIAEKQTNQQRNKQTMEHCQLRVVSTQSGAKSFPPLLLFPLIHGPPHIVLI